MNIYSRIAKITADLGAVAKSNKNKDLHFSYRSIDQIYNAIHPLLAKYEVVMVCDPIKVRTRNFEREKSYNGKAYTQYWQEAKVKGSYTFFAPDGSSVTTHSTASSMDTSDKAITQAMSMMHKYALSQMFSIPTDDADPDSVMPDVQPTRTASTNTPKRTDKTRLVSKTPALSPLDIAINKIKGAKSLDELQEIWQAHKALQKNTAFANAKNLRKTYFS